MPRRRGTLSNANHLEDGRLSCSSSPAAAKTLSKSDPAGAMAIVNSSAIYGQNVEARIGFSMSDAAPTLSDSGYLHKKFKKLAATGGQGGTEEPKNPQGTGLGLGLLPTIAESSGSSGDREGSSSPVPEPNTRSGDGCEDWNRNNKPGRYVCSYCQHACAKPSVLEKHIRAHTNERPYPCLPCGFAFKTKSNLYKHRKSRTHVLKMEEISSAGSGTGSVPEEMSPPTDLSDENEGSDEPEPELLPPLQVVPSSQTVQTSGSLESNPTDRFKTPYKPKFHTWKSVDESALNLLPKIPAGTEKFNPEPNDRTNPKFARSFSEVGRTNQEASLAPGGGVRPQLPSPGFLQARISQIISENQAIVETTDPIWNRRFVRQSSRDRDNPKSRSHVPKAPPPVQATTNRERSCSFSSASSFEATNSSATLTAPSQSEEAMEELHRKRCLSEGRNSDNYSVRSLLQGSWQTEGKDQNPEGSLIKDLLLKSRMEASRSATNGTEASRAASLSFSVSAILQNGPELSQKSPGPSFQTLDRGAGAHDQGKDSPTAKRRKLEMSSPVRKDQQRTSVLLRSFSVDPGSISHGNSQKNEPRPSSALDYRPPQLSGLINPFGSDSLWQQQLTQHPSRSSSLQLFGGEVEICEGDKKRVLRIDPSGFTPEPELPAFHVSPPTFTSGGSSNQDSSVVVMISKSGLNTGGGTVQVHPANPVTRVITSAINIGSGSSVTRRIETQSTTAHTKPRIPYVPGIPGPYSSASALSPVAENLPTQSASSFVIPEITVSPADPEIAAADFADSVNRSRFLRPNTLPLKPGTFQLKRTNMAGLEAGGKPHLVGSGAGMTLVSPETPRPHKLYRQMFLNGHAYTYLGLKCSTRVYFCCLSKPQPMYVQQMDTKLSMYSQWQTRPLPADSSPCGLSPVETMSLYDSRQHGSSYAVANAREGTRLILTHSSYWANRDRPLVSTTNPVTGGSTSPPISICEPEKQAEDKAEENGQQPAVYEPQEPKEPQPKRVRIFAGGFKSNEDYTYVRGRGRGRYVCEECGIRCKKPSMLKKHIRTHTDLRPYTCRQCNFSFKTKGNLTKHMKSKAHHKKCTELGILPVPTSVEEANIDEESLARQEKLKKSASGLAEDSEVDEEDDEDEDEEDDELDDEEEEMDCDSGSAEAVGQFEDADELPVQLPVPEVRGEREQEVARSLLDLGVIARAGSKPTTYPYNSCNNNNTGEKPEVVETPEAPPEVQESPPMDLSIARLAADQLPIQEDPATILSPVTETSSLLASIYMTAQRAAEASGTGNSRSTPASAPEVPPENEMLQAYIKEKALKEGFIKRQQVKEIPARQVEDKPADPEPQHQTAGKEPQERVSVISSASSITQPPAAVVVCASGEGMVPKPRAESAASVAVQSQVFKMTDDGKTACSICNKVFTKPSQLRLHINIHYFERPFRCDSCAVSFRTKGHLQKHKRSVTHFNKVNMNLTFGTPSTENPRPFKCSDCMIAFRIHGHLAKHLRSKMHIMKLECLGKLPFGTYAEIERSGMNLNEIDTSDCHNSLESLQSLAHRLYRQDPSKLSQWQQQDASESSSAAACRERTVSGSSEEFSDLPDDDDDDADDSDGIPCPDVTDSPRVDDSFPQPPTTPHSPPPPSTAPHSPPGPPTAPHSPLRPPQLPVEAYPADNSHWRTLPEAPRPFYPPAHVPMWPRTDGGYPSYVPPIRASPHWSQDPNAVSWMASRGIVLPIPVPGVSQMHGYVPGHLQLVSGGLSQMEDTSYSCELCGKILMGKDALHQHMVTHAQPRPFVCEYCDAGFTTQQHLESHLSLHRQQQQQQQQSS